MSRIGRMPIAVPAGVTVDIAENNPKETAQTLRMHEDGKVYLGTGYSITVDNSTFGYGGEIEAVFVMLENRYPINRQGTWVFGTDTYPMFGYDYA